MNLSCVKMIHNIVSNIFNIFCTVIILYILYISFVLSSTSHTAVIFTKLCIHRMHSCIYFYAGESL